MYFPSLTPLSWRTGATFVHDWLTLAIFVVFLGHLWYALRDSGALSGMFLGHVTREWAARHHAAWLDEMEGSSRPRTGSTRNFGGPGEPADPGGNTEEGKGDLSPRRS
jgi:formate dehydrogenase subunit gamma